MFKHDVYFVVDERTDSAAIDKGGVAVGRGAHTQGCRCVGREPIPVGER